LRETAENRDSRSTKYSPFQQDLAYNRPLLRYFFQKEHATPRDANPVCKVSWSVFGFEPELQGMQKQPASPISSPSILGSVPALKSVAASGSIPWLLIAVKSKSGSGTLDKVDYVLRVATDGGAAPTEPPNGEGATARVKYHAIYIFLRRLNG
jgi:Protein of unknown function (DUF3455)